MNTEHEEVATPEIRAAAYLWLAKDYERRMKFWRAFAIGGILASVGMAIARGLGA